MTGFGLLGHLVEMARPSGVDGSWTSRRCLSWTAPRRPCAAGILSSLQPENVRLRRALRNQQGHALIHALCTDFRPADRRRLARGHPADRAEACLAALRALGYAQAAAIGRVLPQGDALEPIVLHR